MKYIKLYERNWNKRHKIGEYVICEDIMYDELKNFLDYNIGQIISLNPEDHGFKVEYDYVVEYDNIPDNVLSYFISGKRTFDDREIKHSSVNKEDLESILNSKKYNI